MTPTQQPTRVLLRYVLPILTGVLASASSIAGAAPYSYPQQQVPTYRPAYPSMVDPATSRYLPTEGLHIMAQGGISLGGTKMAALQYNDGYHSYQSTIHAGALLNLGLGAVLQFVDSPISMSIGADYVVDVANTNQADITFSRVPLDFMLHLQQGRHRLGLGATQHINIDYDANVYNYTSNQLVTNASVSDHVQYKDATGALAEWSYLIGNSTWFAMRYTNITYQPDTLHGATINNGQSVNGSNIALMIRGIF